MLRKSDFPLPGIRPAAQRVGASGFQVNMEEVNGAAFDYWPALCYPDGETIKRSSEAYGALEAGPPFLWVLRAVQSPRC